MNKRFALLASVSTVSLVFLLSAPSAFASIFGSSGIFGNGGIFDNGSVFGNPATSSATPSAHFLDRTFTTKLTGSQETPPVTSSAWGSGKFKISKDGNAIDFQLKVKNAVGVTQAHLHCGLPGVAGPVVVWLFGNIPGGFNVNGTLADFTITSANIDTLAGCNPAITTMADLENAIRAGDIYANVHTIAHPMGEIRGQLVP